VPPTLADVHLEPPITLDMFPVDASARFPGAFMERSARFHVGAATGLGRVRDDLVARITTRVLGKNLPELTTTRTVNVPFDFPAGWWQHLKHQHQTAWWMRPLTRRWPPRMATITQRVTLTGDVTRAALFPEANALISDDLMGRPVLVTSEPSWKTTIGSWP
jgi:hypothetical protein